MSGFANMPRFLLRIIRLPPRAAYAIGLGPVLGRLVLLLTTYGRKTGKPRVTPLQYEELNGNIYLGAALGQKADWLRNIQANPRVHIQVKNQRFFAHAEVITDPAAVVDYLKLRLERHPKMVGAMLRGEGLPANPTNEDLSTYAASLAVVKVTPLEPHAD